MGTRIDKTICLYFPFPCNYSLGDCVGENMLREYIALFAIVISYCFGPELHCYNPNRRHLFSQWKNFRGYVLYILPQRTKKANQMKQKVHLYKGKAFPVQLCSS